MKINLAAPPGSSMQNKTGHWRIYGPIIDHAKCIGCGMCARVCPEGCVFPAGEKSFQGKIIYEKDLDYCKGCGICGAECPVKAIEMK